MLDAKELRQLADELGRNLQAEGKPFQILVQTLNRLISHLESDQRVYVALEKSTTDRMNKLENQLIAQDKAVFGDKENPDTHPGMVGELRDFRRFMEGNRKIQTSILLCVIGILIKFGFEFITGHRGP